MRGVRPFTRRTGPHTRIARALRPLARDRRGSALIQIGIALPVLMGFAGLGLDVAIWQFERRDMQTAIDAAALATAHALAAGASQAEMEAAANESFADSNFPIEASDVFELHSPPTSGPNAGNSDAVELKLNRPANTYLAGLVAGPVDIDVRAVSGAIVVGTHCIVALDEEQDSALEFTGTADADINCGVASNSRSDRAIHVGGQAILRADPAQAFGDIYVEGTATLDTNRPPQPHSPRVTDPFGPDGRNLQLPLLGSCDPSPSLGGGSGTVTLDPGYFCGDFLIENKTVHFNPGVYVIEDGDFRIKAGSIVTGTDVTFILTGSTPSDVGVLEITSNSQVDLTAPTTGDYAGVLFYEDQTAASYNGTTPYTHSVLGGADTTLNGAMYSAKREILYSGGSTGSGKCLQMVARKVTVTGNTVIDNDPTECGNLSLDQINQTRIRLLE